MILKALKGMSPKAKVWDSKKGKILFTFENGEYETDDEYIIKFWSAFDSSICTTEDRRAGESKPKRKRRTKEEMMRGEV